MPDDHDRHSYPSCSHAHAHDVVATTADSTTAAVNANRPSSRFNKRAIRVSEVNFSSISKISPPDLVDLLPSSSTPNTRSVVNEDEEAAPSSIMLSREEASVSVDTEEDIAASINSWKNRNRSIIIDQEESQANLCDATSDRAKAITDIEDPPLSRRGAKNNEQLSNHATATVFNNKDGMSHTTKDDIEEQTQQHSRKGYKYYKRQLRLHTKEKIHPYWKIILAQILCVLYILVMTFTPPPLGITDPSTHNIIDPNSTTNTIHGVIYVNGALRPIVAIDTYQKICLAISRMSAFSMYPMLVIVFITKMRALQSFFSRTMYSMYFGMIEEGHGYHVFAGRYIAFDVWIHTIFHILRWISQGNISLLVTSVTGITGIITITLTPLIAFPMMFCRKSIRYEIRKGLHYLFYIFAITMCFHVPPSAIPNGGFLPYVLGGSIVAYALDTFYVSLFMTERVETTSFHVLSTGVRISMPVSERFRRNATGRRGGFAYINLPWIDDKQWHPFSLFEDPHDANVRQMFLMKSGDWTDAVHSSLSRDTTRPVWIKGPFPSPFRHAALYDNQILVASGIGITPALGAINAFKSSRRVNLIWAVRDPEMLEFFLEKMYLEHDGWNLIFYTGKKPLNSQVDKLNTNIRVVRGRPNLASIIPNVIYGIESKEGLPEKYTERSKDEMKVLLANRVVELERDSDMPATTKVAKIRKYGQFLGFSLSEMIDEIDRSLDEEALSLRTTDRDPHTQPRDSKSAAGRDDTKNTRLNVLKSSMQSSIEYVKMNNHIAAMVPIIMEGDDAESPSAAECDAEAFLNELKMSVIGYARIRDSRSSSVGDIDVDVGVDNIIWKHPSSAKKIVRSDMMWSSMVRGIDKGDTSFLKPAFCPWEESTSQERCVARFDDDIMSTWGIMYCGGSQPVISALKDISIDYDIDLHIDSFSW